MATTVVVDEHLAGILGTRAVAGLRAVPRGRRRLGVRGPGAIDRAAAVEALAAVDGPVVVLARTARADPQAAALPEVVRAMGAAVITLPDDEDAAAWSIGMAAALAGAEHDAVVRALEVLCCGPDVVTDAPTRPWGRREIPVPALRPVTLARWATCAWTPCTWCARGGAPGWACRRCGGAVDPRADEGAES